MAKVVTRFPPSPTGYFHIGRARTALFNYLYARQNGGEMIFRLEDTDPERSKKKYEDDIIEGLKWLGIEWDNEAIPRQSERTEIYKKYLEKLVSEGKAYVDEKVVRLKNPSKVVTFNDLIRGEISFDTTELEDFIIARNISDPLYHLTVVVDDLEMGITHVIRGDDGIANTPRQILLQEAIAAPRPIYAHVPLILAADRSKLSSRHGAVSLREYREQGYLPEAMLNYLALLGWHPTDNQEVFSLDELMAKFDLERVQKAGAVFDVEKLNWFNKEYLKRLPADVLLAEIRKYLPQATEKLIPEIINRINTFGEIKKMAEAGEWSYFFAPPKPTKEPLKTTEHLMKVIELLSVLTESDFTADKIKSALWDYATQVGRAKVLWPTRVALTGREHSPDPFTVAAILGKEETLARLTYASKL